MLRATTFANALASVSAAAYVVCRRMVSVALDTYAAIGRVTFTGASWPFGFAWTSAYDRTAADRA